MEFNKYPNLEEKYGNTCWENHRREMQMIDNIVENYLKMCKGLRKHNKFSVSNQR